MEDEIDPLSDALASRRIPHSRSRKKGRGTGGKGKNGASQSSFNPLRSLGRYEIQLGSMAKRARYSEESSKLKASPSYLEIHELTAGDDGLIGTLTFDDLLTGICVLAGSRKDLARIVSELEEESERDEDEEDEKEDKNVVDSNVDEDGDNDDDDDDDDKASLQQTGLEAEDEKINRRIRAFEKNSFRNPKFWMRWKGQVLLRGEQVAAEQQSSTEINSGYLIFSNNDCQKFEGTITCEALGWDNMKLQGHKTHSQSTPCPVSWKELG